MGVAKTSRPGTGIASSPTLACFRVWGRLGAESRMPWALQLPRSPAAPGLHCSGLRWRRHACFSTAVPDSLSLEVGGRSRPLQPGVQPQASKQHPLVRRQPLPRPSSNERIRTPQHFLPGCHGGPEGRITADCPPTPTHHYPILLQLSTTPTKYCATSRGRGQGRRGACDVIFGSPPAPPEPSSSASCCRRNDSILSRLDSTSFPSVPVPIEFPPSLRPSSHRPTRISRLVAKIPGWSLPRFTTAPLLPLARLISSLSGAWLAGMVAGAGRVRQKRWGWPAACGR